MTWPSVRNSLQHVPLGRVVAGVVLGCLLGVVGLPRLDLSFLSGSNPFLGASGPAAQATDVPFATLTLEPAVAPTLEPATPVATELEPGMPMVAVLEPATPMAAALEAATPVAASLEPATPVAVAFEPATPVATEPTAVGVPTAAPAPLQLLLAERFAAPLPGWPNDPDGMAWFADGAFRLVARQSGQFVSVGVPLPKPVGDAVVSAQFRKLGGPPGGGYGLILRDQGLPGVRDGRNQGGQYLVLGVGDRGDVGVWKRDETHWIDIVPWTHSEIVRRDLETNSLVVTARGAGLRFEVNGEVVAELTYEGLPASGGIGIFTGGDQNQVALEWLRIEG